jgi:hypothetical protein
MAKIIGVSKFDPTCTCLVPSTRVDISSEFRSRRGQATSAGFMRRLASVSLRPKRPELARCDSSKALVRVSTCLWSPPWGLLAACGGRHPALQGVVNGRHGSG